MQRSLRTENPNPDAVHLGRTIPIPQGRHWLDKMQLKLPSRHKTPQSHEPSIGRKGRKKGEQDCMVRSLNLSYVIQVLIFR